MSAEPGATWRMRAARWLLALVGLALLVWACLDPRFRDAEGRLDGSFCLPLSAALALLVLAPTVGGPLARAAHWFALAVAGQALSLQLIEAGNLVRYQHYAPIGESLGAGLGRAMLMGLAAQALLVAGGLWRIRVRMRTRLTQLLSRRGWIAFGVVFALTSTAALRELSRFSGELLLASFVQILALGNVVLVVAALDRRILGAMAARLAAWFRSSGASALPTVGAMWTVAFAALFAFVSYERHPHIPDEVAYTLQAGYFAEGVLSMPIPPVPDAFNTDLMQYEEDRWYSPFPPGWPAILALGTKLGVAWLVNPLLNGLNVLLAYALVLRLYDRSLARLVLLLLCTSPWFLFMGMNLMSHTSALTFALAAALGFVRMRQTQRPHWAWLAGGATGVLSVIRPWDGVALAGLLGACALFVRGTRFRFAPLAAFAGGTLAVGALALPYNAHITGRPTYTPVMAYFDHYYGKGVNDLGFGPDRGVHWTGLDPRHGHDFYDALLNADLNTFCVNVELHGWPTGSLLLIAFGLVAGSLRRTDWILVAAGGLIVAFYSLYWFNGGPDFGARYWYMLLPACLVLSARGSQILAERLQTTHSDPAALRVRAGIVALCGMTLLAFVPWRAIDKYPVYRDMRPGIRNLVESHGFGRDLVLVRGRRHPDYASAVVYNPVDLQADAPVFAWDRGPEIRTRLAAAFPDRRVWIVDGPTLTGLDYRVVAGPISPADFAARATSEVVLPLP